MFDKLFEFIKGLIISHSPNKTPPKQDTPIVAKDISKEKSEKNISETKNTSEIPHTPANIQLPTEKSVIPTSPKKSNISALAQNKASLEEQRKLLEERRKIPHWILLLKYLSLFLFFFGGFGYLWLVVDIDPQNSYLSLFGFSENVGLKYESLNRQQKFLEEENQTLAGKIRRIDTQLETKKYSIFTDTIRDIRSNQFLWFDQKDEEGDIQYGILNVIDRMEHYFNSRDFDHLILLGSGNSIEINNVSVSRDDINFSVFGANLFGKVFFLNTEFIKVMNSFPLFQGGEIKSFSKKKDKEGNDAMDFSIKFEIQSPDSEDSDDEYFSTYEDWTTTHNFYK
jgi:hypothetical protein